MNSPRTLAVFVVVAAVVTGNLSADVYSADPPDGSIGSSAKSATDKGADAPAVDRPKKTVDLLDRELLRELVPELPLDEPEEATKSKASLPDELDRAVASMRDVTERLDRKDVSEETSQLQTSILDNIDTLIERLKNQPPPQSSSSQSDQSKPDQQNRNEQSGSPQNQEQKADSNASKPKAGTGSKSQSQAEKSEESSETNPREAQERAAALARRRALVNEVWGHLPPAIRERLLNVQSEKLLPGYESMIRRYYESLANSHKAR
jgi:hypothetical protein